MIRFALGLLSSALAADALRPQWFAQLPSENVPLPLQVGLSPALQGLEFTAQGLVMTANLGWAEFTNPLSATIR